MSSKTSLSLSLAYFCNLKLYLKKVSSPIRNNNFIPGFFSALFRRTPKDSEAKAKGKDIKKPAPAAEESTPSKKQGENHGVSYR